MSEVLDLKSLREDIDDIDTKIIELIADRQKKILKVAEYKKEHELPVFSPDRESEIFDRVDRMLGKEDSSGYKLLYGFLMDINKYYEYECVESTVDVPTKAGGASIRAVIDDTPFSLCRYLCPLAVADVSVLSIRSQPMPGNRLLIDLDLDGNTDDHKFATVLSVLADAAEKFTIL